MPFDGSRIRVFRKTVGITQQNLGDILDVPQSTVARWETGRISPNAEHIGLLCDLGRVQSIGPDFFFPAYSRLDLPGNLTERGG